jgi:hypothetical protein
METYARNTEEFARRTSRAVRFLAWLAGVLAVLAVIGIIVTGVELAHVASVVNNPASSCQSQGGCFL